MRESEEEERKKVILHLLRQLSLAQSSLLKGLDYDLVKFITVVLFLKEENCFYCSSTKAERIQALLRGDETAGKIWAYQLIQNTHSRPHTERQMQTFKLIDL